VSLTGGQEKAICTSEGELVSDNPSLLGRTRKLLTTAAIAPAIGFGVAVAGLIVQDTQNLLITAGVAVVLGGVGLWIRWGVRNQPNLWQQAMSFTGVAAGGLLVAIAAGGAEDNRFGLSETAVMTVAVVIAVGLALLAWLPAARAARLVLADLSSDVVDSSLVVTFTARGKDADTLSVTTDSLDVVVRPTSARKTTHSFPLSEVTGVSVRTETDHGEHPVPGTAGTSMRVPPGEVVVVDIGEGKLMFAAKDAHQAKDFVEARARRWASVGEG